MSAKNEARAARIAELAAQGFDQGQIARELECNPAIVWRVLNPGRDVRSKSTRGTNARLTDAERGRIHRLWEDDGLSRSEIARRVGCTRLTVTRVLDPDSRAMRRKRKLARESSARMRRARGVPKKR
jgi:DNA invertase Pin-like site-specific DNA recombinase